MFSAKTAKGVSLKTLELYAAVFFFRLLSILRHQGYLPYDKSGDWFYHFVEIFSQVLVGVAIYLVFVPLMPTYNEKYGASILTSLPVVRKVLVHSSQQTQV